MSSNLILNDGIVKKKTLTQNTCKGKEVTKKMDLKSKRKKLNKDEI
jgi:hypothetical protein